SLMPNDSIPLICWSNMACCPTCVERKMKVATAPMPTTTASAPNQCGRAATSAYVARGASSTPKRRAIRLFGAAAGADGVVSVTSTSSGTKVGGTPSDLCPRQYAFSPPSVRSGAMGAEDLPQHAETVLQT